MNIHAQAIRWQRKTILTTRMVKRSTAGLRSSWSSSRFTIRPSLRKRASFRSRMRRISFRKLVPESACPPHLVRGRVRVRVRVRVGT